MNIALIIVQLIVNILYGLLRKPIGRKFKRFSLVFFPLMAVLLPILPLAMIIIQVMMSPNLDSAPDSTAVSTPVLVPVGFEGSIIILILPLIITIAVQLFFNRWGLQLLSNLRK